MTDEVSIRAYRPGDLDALYRICLLTADDGQDATALHGDPQLPGHLFAAPYALFEPALAIVAEDAAGVGGYVLGALDSQAFEDRLERDWWPRLRRRYADPSGIPAADRTPDQRLAYFIHHHWRTPDELAARYPAHLHIDLLPRLQGRGQGRLLIGAVVAALRGLGSRGVHLNVNPGNERAAGFYPRVGFTEEPATDVRLFVRDLQPPARPRSAAGP